jgi:phosphoribosylamine--glycine ligase
MKVLIIGSGGREHALAWKVAQSPRVTKIFVAPGNGGTAREATNVPISATNVPELLKFASREKIDLTIVGPESALAAGVSDAFREKGLKVFGPSKAAAELESSKIFCKQLLRQADIPTADFQVFRRAEEGIRYIKELHTDPDDSAPLVVKADGLASGKGVIVCSKAGEVLEAVDRVARQREFGEAGRAFIIEERLEGQEASVLAITDGRTIVTLPPAQDHKAAYDGDQGPNTGGMGAYSPTPLIDEEMLGRVERDILVPVVHALKRSRRPFKGVLYAGLMITHKGPKVLEFNARFGDPECQPLLMRLQSDLLDLLEATVDHRLDQIEPPRWDPRAAVCVVMASEGYPGEFTRGHEIRGIEDADAIEHVKVFHAGTTLDGDKVVADGGRVLGVTALGEGISQAKLQAYRGVRCIRWNGGWCRKDISDKALDLPLHRTP